MDLFPVVMCCCPPGHFPFPLLSESLLSPFSHALSFLPHSPILILVEQPLEEALEEAVYVRKEK
jgi:hypothetical protein